MTRVMVDNRVVDLEKPIRLTKAAQPGRPGFTCEGVLSEPPEIEVRSMDVLRIKLLFFGDATAEWVPAYGDTVENI